MAESREIVDIIQLPTSVDELVILLLSIIGAVTIIRNLKNFVFKQNISNINNDNIIKIFIDSPKENFYLGAALTFFGVFILFNINIKDNIYLKLAGAFVTEIGFALIIAFVLHITVEFHARRQKDKEISKGIISYVYGNDLDDNVFRSTESHIFNAKFYRTNVRLDYDFIKYEEGKLLLKQTFEYDVQNISRENTKYPIVCYVEKSNNNKILKLSENHDECISPGLQKIFVNSVQVSSDDMKKASDAVEDSDEFFKGCHEINLEPSQFASVKTVSFLEKFERDYELWRSLRPCDGVRATIRSSCSVKFDIQIAAVHPLESFDFKNEDHGVWTVEINHPLFPHNGIHFWWDVKA